jgi:pimeloyl-ACP methyl ester carboxylesterase
MTVVGNAVQADPVAPGGLIPPEARAARARPSGPDSAGRAAFGAYSAPSLALLGLEPVRAAIEYVGARLMDRSSLPEGDGHPVLLFPGLAADKTALGPLKSLCDELGYHADDWGRGFNTGPEGEVEAFIDELAGQVQRVAEHRQRRVSLIGWSLGGIYAREIARVAPDHVRQVITLGTPFAGDGDATNVGWLYRVLSGQRPHVDPALAERLRATPPVPTTSVYSRSDGVVAWQACRERGDHAQAENVEVEASHIGLVWHPKVWRVIADRLSQEEAGWQPYRELQAPAANDDATVRDAALRRVA